MEKVHFILYVRNQQESMAFYSYLLQKQPVLNVPGMTEFDLNDGAKLGLMPEAGIAKIIGDKLPHPAGGNGIPRCELYLMVENPNQYYQRAIERGGRPVSVVQKRDWGHTVGYVSDPDGHVLAFAKAE